ncbi:phosphoprotein phosphatase [Tritrichomonas foetus]|uniref:Phosphoprotein phosphatase n=1 Tax=Tritrichomonas foetus TaxID=1144522 RepID=A0A1J4L4D8_9EUKA|nr:phosphoprotein phosphatase [Tritrichomonas foetus]|eukprot:OHT16797.1 phosphoprotein phosphatase [Tritrichomonas foetus]
MSVMLLSRYSNKRSSALSIKKRSASSTALQKLAYHTSRYATLEPISEATTPAVPKSKSMSSIDEPVDEVIPNTLMTVELVKQKHHKDIQLPSLPNLPATIDNNAFPLIEKKLDLCCTLCDFTDTDVDRSAKSIKTQTLKELMNVFDSPTVVKNVSDSLLDSFFKMIKINLNRGLPSIPKKYLFYDDEPMMVDIAWAHLSNVYQLISKYQQINPRDKRFDHDYLNLMYSLLHAPDINERDFIVSFFTLYLETFPDQENSVLEKLSNILVGYRDKVYDPFCVIPCLRIFQTRFKLKTEIDQNHLKFFYKAILPLHNAKHIFSYYNLLSDIMSFLISLDNELSMKIFFIVLKSWPEARPSKQILFINMINFIIERVPPEKFEKVAKPLFSLYARCSQNCHYKVVDASFQIWGNVTILPMILDNTRIIYPIVYPWFNKTMKEHWSNRTQNAALNTLKSMHDTDPFMFDELSQNQNQKKGAPPPIDPKAAQLHKNWALVARSAAKVDKNVNLARILAEIQIKFNTVSSADKSTPAKKKPNNPPPQHQSTPPAIVSPVVRGRMF